jgi:hypothetical protein
MSVAMTSSVRESTCTLSNVPALLSQINGDHAIAS